MILIFILIGGSTLYATILVLMLMESRGKPNKYSLKQLSIYAIWLLCCMVWIGVVATSKNFNLLYWNQAMAIDLLVCVVVWKVEHKMETVTMFSMSMLIFICSAAWFSQSSTPNQILVLSFWGLGVLVMGLGLKVRQRSILRWIGVQTEDTVGLFFQTSHSDSGAFHGFYITPLAFTSALVLLWIFVTFVWLRADPDKTTPPFLGEVVVLLLIVESFWMEDNVELQTHTKIAAFEDLWWTKSPLPPSNASSSDLTLDDEQEFEGASGNSGGV